MKLSTSKYKDFLSRNYDFMCIRSYLRLVRGSHSLFVAFAGKTDVKRVSGIWIKRVRATDVSTSSLLGLSFSPRKVHGSRPYNVRLWGNIIILTIIYYGEYERMILL